MAVSSTTFPSAQALLHERICNWRGSIEFCEQTANTISETTDQLTSLLTVEETDLQNLSDERIQSYKRGSDAVRAHLVCQLVFKSTNIPALLDDISQLKSHLELATPQLETTELLSARHPKMSEAHSFVDALKHRAEQAQYNVSEARSRAWIVVSSSLNGRPNILSQVTQTLSAILPLPGEDCTQTTAMYLALQPLLTQKTSDGTDGKEKANSAGCFDPFELSQSMLDKWEARNQSVLKFNTELSAALKSSLPDALVRFIAFRPRNDFADMESVQQILHKMEPFSKPVDLQTDQDDPSYTLANVGARATPPAFTALLDRIDKIGRDAILYRERTDTLIQEALSKVVPSLGWNPIHRSYAYLSAWVTGSPSSIELEKRTAWIQAFSELLAN